jgi:hypothetical protein
MCPRPVRPCAPQLAPFFANCMDRATINTLGVAPLQPFRALSINSIQDAMSAMGALTARGMSPLFTICTCRLLGWGDARVCPDVF